MSCGPARGVACQERHNLQVCSVDTCTKNRHAARDDVGRYTPNNLPAMLQNVACYIRRCQLHRAHCNTQSPHRDFVYSSVAGVPAAVVCSAPLSLFAAAYPATSEEYCSS